MEKFGIGQAVSRVEDQRLTRGAGYYIEDVNIDQQSWAVFVRSPHANARILEIDTATAEEMPGVLGIYTAEDLAAAGIGNVPCTADANNIDGSPCKKPPRPALAQHQVRHVGDAVVLVVAESQSIAADAAEQIWIDYEVLDAVTDPRQALDQSSVQIWDDIEENRSFHWQDGDAVSTDSALQQATQVVELELVNNRVIPASMETRGAIAECDTENGRLTLHVSCQGVHIIRNRLSQVFNCDPEDLHVKCYDVGGGFGMKIFLFPEYVAVLFATRILGRPVKWISDRSEAFLSDTHGRDHVTHLQMALNADAKILGLKVHTIANLGAYLSNAAPFVATAAGVSMLVGCYAIPTAHVEVQGVFTNTAPVDAYRGAGRPEAIYAIERLLDVAAQESGLGPDEIRRRNFIPVAAMPYETAFGLTYDSGDFQQNLQDALDLANWQDFPQRKLLSVQRNKLRGIGLACYIERCAGGAPEQARLQVNNKGEVTLFIGTQSNGQGHETAFRQILAERLSVEFADIHIVQGDSDLIESGGGTMGSRSVPVGGAAISAAAEKIVEQARIQAAELLESAVADIEFNAGEFRIVGTDRSTTFKKVAESSANESGVSFDEKDSFAPADPTYPNGTHICELEIDKATGTLEIIDYIVVDDFGHVINPLLLEGQVHGGIAQGLGQAILEDCVYENGSGQLLSASFMDYTMPRADDLPMIRFKRNEVPCRTNPLGIKGAGEAGAIGAPPAIVNAIVNALSDFGVRHIDMPITPARIWSIMH